MNPEELFKILKVEIEHFAFNAVLRVGNYNIKIDEDNDIGKILLSWLDKWLSYKQVDHKKKFIDSYPDIFLDPSDHTHSLLEVKAFNYEATPGFDIADFKSYQREIIRKPWMLYTKYIIFGYSMDDSGIVTIKKLWLKNVWEICRPSARWAVNVQYKNGMVQKIRPATWFSQSKAVQFKPFDCLEDFLSAVEDTVYANPDTRGDAVDWKRKMLKSYEKFYGKKLLIPRWMDVCSKYDNRSKE